MAVLSIMYNARRRSGKKRCGKFVWKKLETLKEEPWDLVRILRLEIAERGSASAPRHGEAVALDLLKHKQDQDPQGGTLWCLHPDLPSREAASYISLSVRIK